MCCLVLDVGVCVFFPLCLNANMLLTAVLCSMHHVALAWRTCGVCVWCLGPPTRWHCCSQLDLQFFRSPVPLSPLQR